MIWIYGLSGNPPTGNGGHFGIIKYFLAKNMTVWVVPVYQHIYSTKQNLIAFHDRMQMLEVIYEDINEKEKQKLKILTIEKELYMQLKQEQESSSTANRTAGERTSSETQITQKQDDTQHAKNLLKNDDASRSIKLLPTETSAETDKIDDGALAKTLAGKMKTKKRARDEVDRNIKSKEDSFSKTHKKSAHESLNKPKVRSIPVRTPTSDTARNENENGEKPIRVSTYDMIQELKHQHPKEEFGLILGSDTFQDLMDGKWNHSNELIQLLYGIAVIQRNAQKYDVAELKRKYPILRSLKHLEYYEIPSLRAISSTIVRDCHDSKLLQQYVHPKVADYITKHHLYGFSHNKKDP